MTTATKLLTIFSFSLMTTAQAMPKEAWNPTGAPGHLLDQYEARLDALPKTGHTATTPWTDYYWANNKRGLAWRWQAGADEIAKLPTREELGHMSAAEIDQLSPAEKYDIYRGLYNYPLTKRQLERTNPNQPLWWGMCHGWAAAALSFAEPNSIDVRTQDGLMLKFTAGDLKALLDFAQQDRRPATATRFLGVRCDEGFDTRRHIDAPYASRCKGVNAGAFHIVLTNLIGTQKKGFIGDLSLGEEVWNYPFYSYSTEIVSETDQVYEHAAPGTKKIVEVAAAVQTMPSASTPSTEAVGETEGTEHDYHYTLELDADGRIIGGKWTEREQIPEFLWTQTPFHFEGDYAPLKALYDQATSAGLVYWAGD